MHLSINKYYAITTFNFEHDMKGGNIEFIDAKFVSSHI